MDRWGKCPKGQRGCEDGWDLKLCWAEGWLLDIFLETWWVAELAKSRDDRSS